ncbi:hypothetical protein LAZ67_X002577 [Cordylochernes scorpioides]|uniref:Uncharacterized protein n=1 Tax=Cordylochernes scorpioides TaxID=51811 RepID=A0ABY6LVM1_9ARAC|nr:hypothetical protein LAZ67_X002577 [Cordylochernes scorpioides]
MMEPLCIKSELDLFSGLPIQVAIENSDFEEVHPIATLSDGPIEFYIPGTFEHYIDPSFIFLQLAVKISKRNGSTLADTNEVGPINYLLNTAFENIEVFINEKQIVSQNNYGYRSILDALLNIPENSQKTFLKSSLFEKDTAKYFDETDPNGRYLSSGELNITPEEFQNGLTLFAFDTTLDLCASYLHSSVTQNSNISLEVKFSSALTSTINLILHPNSNPKFISRNCGNYPVDFNGFCSKPDVECTGQSWLWVCDGIPARGQQETEAGLDGSSKKPNLNSPFNRHHLNRPCTLSRRMRGGGDVTTGITSKSRHAVEYPDLPSAMRPAPHSDYLPVPYPPENVIFSYDDSDRREQQLDDTNFEAGHKNIINPPLIDSENIYLCPLHIKLGLMKNFVKAMDRNASGFAYLKQKCSSISDAKIKKGIFLGHQIRELLQDGNFQNSLNEVEAAAWNSFRNVCKNLLGSVKIENYRDIVNDLILS